MRKLLSASLARLSVSRPSSEHKLLWNLIYGFRFGCAFEERVSARGLELQKDHNSIKRGRQEIDKTEEESVIDLLEFFSLIVRVF